MTDHPIRLGIIATHPIQYLVPTYRQLARSSLVDATVIYLSDFGVHPSFDRGYGLTIAYDVPLLDGYNHVFIKEGAPSRPGILHPPGRRFYRLLRRRQFDVILVPGWGTIASLSACVVARSVGIPYVLRGDTSSPTGAGLSRWCQIRRKAVLLPLFRQAGSVAVIGHSNERFFRSYGVPAERMASAPYSVDNEFFAAAGRLGRRARSERLCQLGLDPTHLTVVFVAKLLPKKRPLDLVAAVRRCKIPLNLLVIGDGPLRSEVERAARQLQAARVLGFVNQSELGLWYGLSDAIVLPSDYEPWGLVINEAMATGAVPVVSDAVGCAEDLVHPDSGIVFPVGDIDAITAALEYLGESPGRLAAMRAAARAVVDDYSIERTARGIEQAAVLAAEGRG